MPDDLSQATSYKPELSFTFKSEVGTDKKAQLSFIHNIMSMPPCVASGAPGTWTVQYLHHKFYARLLKLGSNSYQK